MPGNQEDEEKKVRDEFAKLYAEWMGRQIGADGLNMQQWIALGSEGYNSPLYKGFVDANRGEYARQMEAIDNIKINVVIIGVAGEKRAAFIPPAVGIPVGLLGAIILKSQATFSHLFEGVKVYTSTAGALNMVQHLHCPG